MQTRFIPSLPFLLVLLSLWTAMASSHASPQEVGDRLGASVDYTKYVWVTGTLEGFSEFTAPHDPPKCPPRKYKRMDQGGTMSWVEYSTDCVRESSCTHARWGGHGEFYLNAAGTSLDYDPSQLWMESKKFDECEIGDWCCDEWWPKAYGEDASGYHAWQEIEDTSRTWYGGLCPDFYFDHTSVPKGPITQTLSDPDTVPDAIARAGGPRDCPMPSLYGIIAFPMLWSGYSFNEQSVDFEYKFCGLECGATYEITYKFEKIPSDGSGDWEPFTESYTHVAMAGHHEGKSSIPQIGEEESCLVYFTRLVEVYAEKTAESTSATLAACGGGCGPTSCGTGPGDGDGGPSSLFWYFSLGASDREKSAGVIWIRQDELAPGVLTPAALNYRAPSEDIDVVLDQSEVLRQVFAPQTLADIVVIDASEYEINFYHSSEVDPPDSNGLYPVNGISPFVTWRIRNPDAGQSIFERLQIIRERGGSAEINEFVYEEIQDEKIWRLTKGDGLQVTEVAYSTNPSGDTVRSTVVKNAQDEVAMASTETIHEFPFGARRIEKEDVSGATTWVYYTDELLDGNNYGRLKQVERPSGAWQRYEYNENGARAKTISPFKDSSSASMNESDHRVVEVIRLTFDLNGDGHPDQVVTEIQRTLGVETARSYSISWGKTVEINSESFRSKWEVQSQTAGAAWHASDNLVAKTLVHAGGDHAGEVFSVHRSDNTATLFFYSQDELLGGKRTVQKSGVPLLDGNGYVIGISEGTETETVVGEFGQSYLRRASDIVSQVILDEQFSSPEEDFDAFGRVEKITYLDGTTVIRQYACCSLESETDREGVITAFSHDALGRVIGRLHNGIGTVYELDAMGRKTKVTRTGTDSTDIVINTSSFDSTGRLILSIDAAGEPTGIAYEDGGALRRTTFADGSQRVEEYFLDGSLKANIHIDDPNDPDPEAPSHRREYDYGVDFTDGAWVKETRIGLGGATSEWTQTFTNMTGRRHRIESSSGLTETHVFNPQGQLIRIHRGSWPNPITLFSYNDLGELEYTAVDLNHNHTIDFSGTDRITRTTREIDERDGQDVVVRRTALWTTDNSTSTHDASVTETSTNGLETWQTEHGLTTHTKTVIDGQGGRTVTTTRPDGSYRVEQYQDRRLLTTTEYREDETQIARTVYAYDPHGRLASETDARNGITLRGYDNADRVTSITQPGNQITLIDYDSRGRQSTVTHPDGGTVQTTYYPTGEKKRTWGSRTYPVDYTYDPQGRMKTMTTWQDFPADSGKAVTTWNYHPSSGLLASREDDDGKGASYTYDTLGRLKTRTWARSTSQVTEYDYNTAGDLASVYHWDGTPNLTYQYDRLGHLKRVTAGSDGRDIQHAPDGRLLFEEGLSGLDSDFVYDSLNRLERVDLRDQTTQAIAFSQNYGYEPGSGRLATVGMGDHQAAYGYHANSNLIHTLAYENNGTPVLTATRQYDNLNRLTSIGTGTMTHQYQYNNANQRTRADREDGSYWAFDYDDLGQVTSGNRYWTNGIPVEGQQFGYLFDDIGNREETTRAGRAASYQNNLLNQIEERDVPGYIDLHGHVHPEATVTVNLENATRQQDGYFHKALPLDNTAQDVYEEVKVVGVRNAAGPNDEDVVSEVTGNLFLPADPESFQYDPDGNLLQDGQWTYTWNAENRLIRMETRFDLASTLPRKRLEFTYDHRGRRAIKKAFNDNSGTWQLNETIHFVYQGWNLIAELNGSGNLLRSYAWGLDLSNTLEGAGGVGGLVFIHDHDEDAVYYPGFDGNGNVTALFDSTDASVAAIYEYGPFGETIRATGPAADLNPFRFSTKYQDAETDLYYYGYRYYSPSMGRWLNRDPINEPGARMIRSPETPINLIEDLNLYAFVANDPVNFSDFLGLEIQWSIGPNRAGDGVSADIWYVNAEEECCGGEVKFKQRAKTTGLTVWRRLNLPIGVQRWHWDPLGSNYPHWYPHQWPQLGSVDGSMQTIYMMEDRPGGETYIQQEFWTMAFCFYSNETYFPLEGITWGYDMREFGDINVWATNQIPGTYRQ